MSRFLARMLPAVVPLVLLAAVVPASHAERVVTEDAVGDVQSMTFDVDSSEEAAPVPAPEEASVDITRTVVTHGNRRLEVTVHLRDLVTSRYTSTYVRVFTSSAKYDLELAKVPGSRAEVSFSAKRRESCRGLRGTVDGTADTVTFALPTSCIGSPRWVRVGVGAVGFDAAFEEALADGGEISTLTVFADDGHRGTIRDNSIGKGPKVRRG